VGTADVRAKAAEGPGQEKEHKDAAGEGITPLEVLLAAARKAQEEGDLKTAAASAKEAAPYCRPADLDCFRPRR
jgi:hypothetical protein